MRPLTALVVASLLLFGLPLAGVKLAGHELAAYLEFPPRTGYIVHAPFSWTVFALFALLIGGMLTPFVLRVVKTHPPAVSRDHRRRFPWWGWVGLGLGLVAWFLAWSRFAWFAPWQRWTFTPLWLAYVLVVNALTYRRRGHCALVDRPRHLLLLFPVSAWFWWSFEYLNRFVQNWSYVSIDTFTPWQYVWYATLPFATVLPAVLSTSELLRSFPRVSAGLDHCKPLRIAKPRCLGGAAVVVGSGGLVVMSVWPDYGFPVVWMAPVLILTACQALLGMPTIFTPALRGDWRPLWLWALAALVCGGFWEMWNAYSLAKWVYSVPFVNRFHLFEMPLLGYGGYLPFGLGCATVASLLVPGQIEEQETGFES
jgi:hypothetical protein